jgi:hypothetical protein
MAINTLSKVVVITVSVRVPRQVKDQFIEAVRIISEITPNKPVVVEELISFTLFKETTASIVIEYLEWVQNRDHSVRLVRHKRCHSKDRK